jgi:hypothetical protein
MLRALLSEQARTRTHTHTHTHTHARARVALILNHQRYAPVTAQPTPVWLNGMVYDPTSENGVANAGDKTSKDNNLLLYIIIAAAAVLVLIVLVVTRCALHSSRIHTSLHTALGSFLMGLHNPLRFILALLTRKSYPISRDPLSSPLSSWFLNVQAQEAGADSRCPARRDGI